MTTRKTPVKAAEVPEEEVILPEEVAGSNDVETLAPTPDTITLVSGFVVKVEPLRTRGMFKLLKIVTRGAGPIIMQMPMDFDNPEEFAQQMLAVVVMAVPEAEDAALEFIQAMVVPAEFIEAPKTKAQENANRALFEELVKQLDDPDMMDTISIIENIILREAGDLRALGKRLGSVMKVQMASLGAKNSSSKN